MTLQFTSDAPAGDQGLNIRFDLKGIQGLLEAIHGAVAEGKLTIDGGAPGGFATVTFTFVEPRTDRPAARTPTPSLELEPV